MRLLPSEIAVAAERTKKELKEGRFVRIVKPHSNKALTLQRDSGRLFFRREDGEEDGEWEEIEETEALRLIDDCADWL